MTGADWLTLLASVCLLAWICRALNAPTWLTIAAPLTYVALALGVMSV